MPRARPASKRLHDPGQAGENSATAAPPARVVAFNINGQAARVAVTPNRTLLEVVREDLRLTGTKHGCELGECGACTVLVDGAPRLACLTLAVEVEARALITIEGLAWATTLHPVQQAFVDHGAIQCGYCTAGMILTAAAFLAERERDGEPLPPTDAEVREALAGNLCRCTGYAKIVDAVSAAAGSREQTADAEQSVPRKAGENSPPSHAALARK